jgi:hypothetical protein
MRRLERAALEVSRCARLRYAAALGARPIVVQSALDLAARDADLQVALGGVCVDVAAVLAARLLYKSVLRRLGVPRCAYYVAVDALLWAAARLLHALALA